jgi:hypothetical protein
MVKSEKIKPFPKLFKNAFSSFMVCFGVPTWVKKRQKFKKRERRNVKV